MKSTAFFNTDKLWHHLNEMVLGYEQTIQRDEVPVSRDSKAVNYQEISMTDAPTIIKSVLSKGFDGFSSIQFFEGTDGTYKVVASNNNEKCSIYFDKEQKS